MDIKPVDLPRSLHDPVLPEWLTGAPAREPGLPATVLEEQYPVIFDRLLEWVGNGDTATDFMAADGRVIDAAHFRRWIKKDRARVAQLNEAKRLGCDPIEDKLQSIAAGTDDVLDSDIERAKLRVSTLKWLMGVWDRDRYGEKKQIDITQSIDIRANLEAANARVIEGTLVAIESDDDS